MHYLFDHGLPRVMHFFLKRVNGQYFIIQQKCITCWREISLNNLPRRFGKVGSSLVGAGPEIAECCHTHRHPLTSTFVDQGRLYSRRRLSGWPFCLTLFQIFLELVLLMYLYSRKTNITAKNLVERNPVR